MYKFWMSAVHLEDVNIKKIVPLMFAEIISAVGNFLEIEYKVLGDDLVKLWLMIFALSAINTSSKDIEPCFLLASKISSLSAQVICTFSELRQVGYVLSAVTFSTSSLNYLIRLQTSDALCLSGPFSPRTC
jgi:hypothetical protein